MSVHYKFKSSLDYDTITYDGLHISVGDLKKAILAQKKIGKGFDFDLQITNAQTKEIYSDDEALIPKNASVIVSRVPNSLSAKKAWERNDSSTLLPMVAQTDGSNSMSFDKVTKNADLVSSNVSEDEKIRTMMSQSTQDYDPSRYVKTKGMSGPIPPNYTCFRCGRAGHWIKNCPTNSLEVKRSTGIPRSFMVTVQGPEVPGALLTSSGQFAVPMIDHEAYKEGKKERPPFFKEMSPEKEQVPQVPEELLCMICRDLLSDAVLIPCCGNSYCDECVRQALLDSDEHECPTCHEKDISPDTLIPNRFLRTAVMNFKNETGYTKIKKPVIKIPPSTTTEAPAAESTEPAQAEGVEPDSQTDANSPAAATVETDHIAPANGSSQVSVTSTTDERPGTPVRDEHLEGDAAADAGGSAVDLNEEKNAEEVESKERPSSPVTYSNPITTITTRLRMSPLMPMTMPAIPPKPRPKPQPQPQPPPAPIPTSSKPPPLMSQETTLRLPPSLTSGSSGSALRSLASQQSRLDASLSYVTPSSSSLPLLAPATTGPSTYTSSTYSTPPPTLKPPPGIIMPPLGVLPPPPGHLLGMPPHFSHSVRHPPPPIPSMFHGPPPIHPGMRRPMLPPPGPNPLGANVQPLPPGVRPMLPPLLPPGDAYRHHQPMEPYPPRTDNYYRDHRPYPDRDRSNHDPMDAFARELFEYRPRRHRSRRRSASSSRSCSSRSGYHSCSPSTRSRSRSARSSRSRSISYSSRSRSSSPNYSHSPYSQRSRSQSRSRSRSRSRSKTGKYSSPAHRKSRSHSPRGRRSPHPHPHPPPPPPRRRRDYSPSYYHNVYRGPPQAVPPQQINVPPYEMPPRGRYADPYRYENYRYEEDPRYPMRDARYDYSHYDEYYHRGGMHANRAHRGWMGQVPGKPEDHRPARAMREGGPRRGVPPLLAPPVPTPPHRSRSPLVNQNDKEQIGGRERDRDREWNSRRYPDKSRGYREAEQEHSKEFSGPNCEPIGTRKLRKVRESGSEEKEKGVTEKEKKATTKPVEEKSSRSSAASDKDKSKDKHHKRKVHHHGGGKGESPIKKVKVSKKGSEVDATPTSDSPSATSRKSARKKKKKVKEGGDADSSSKSASPNKETRKASKQGKDDKEESSKGSKGAHASAEEEKISEEKKENAKIRTNAGTEPVKSHEPLVDYKENEGAEERSGSESPNANLDKEITRDGRKMDIEETASQRDNEVPRLEIKEDDELTLSVGAEELVDDEETEEQKSTVAENVLTAPVPELSKWELDDVEVNRQDDMSSQSYGKQRYKGKTDTKHSLPPDIVQRAEKAILQKALKGIVPVSETVKTSRKPAENKAPVERDDGQAAREEATLKVSIDNGSSKRTVEKTSKDAKEGRDRVRLDRSKFVDPSARNESPNQGPRGSKSVKEEERRETGADGRQKEQKGESGAGKGRSGHDAKPSGRHQRADSVERNPRSGRQEERRSGGRHEDAKRTSRSQERDRRSRSQERHSAKERSGGDQGDARSRENQHHPPARREAASERERRDAGSRNREAIQKGEKEGRRNASSPERSAGRRKESETEGRQRRTGASREEEDDERRSEQSEGAARLPRDRRSSTIDESKFEPDYDDADEPAQGGGKVKVAAASREVEAKKRRSSSSASTESSAPSSPGSSSPTAAKKRKSSPSPEVKSKHKKSKHKKHKKHKHKHKKNKKNKQKDEDKDGGKGVKSIVKH